MPSRQPATHRAPPRLWLMTDERQGEALFMAIERLPRGAGIVFRHFGLPPTERRALFCRVRQVACKRGIVLVVAGGARDAARLRADGFHELSARIGPRHLLRTAPAHNPAELVLARRARVDLVFVSPAFATRSHPGKRALGRARFGLLARGSAVRVIALGGMTARQARALPSEIYGWGAIDGLTGARRRGGRDNR